MPESWTGAWEVVSRSELPTVRDLATAIAVKFGDRRAFPTLRRRLLDADAPIAERRTALDVLVWGVVALIIQLATFFVIDFLLRGLPKRIEEGQIAPAIFLAAAKLAVAIITASALT